MCRDILNTCVRNTEDAEKAATGGNCGDTTSGKKTAVWGMIEESELAKTIRGGFDKVQYHGLMGLGAADALISSRSFQLGMRTHLSRKSARL